MQAPYREQMSHVKFCINKVCTHQAGLWSVAWIDALCRSMCGFLLYLRMEGISVIPISSISYVEISRTQWLDIPPLDISSFWGNVSGKAFIEGPGAIVRYR